MEAHFYAVCSQSAVELLLSPKTHQLYETAYWRLQAPQLTSSGSQPFIGIQYLSVLLILTLPLFEHLSKSKVSGYRWERDLLYASSALFVVILRPKFSNGAPILTVLKKSPEV